MPASHRDTGRQLPRSKLRWPRVFHCSIRTRMDPASTQICPAEPGRPCVLPATLVCQDAQSALGIVRRAVYPKRMFMHMLILSVLILNRLPRMLRPSSPQLLRPPGGLPPQQSDEQRSFCSRPQRRSSSAYPRAPALLFLGQVTTHCIPTMEMAIQGVSEYSTEKLPQLLTILPNSAPSTTTVGHRNNGAGEMQKDVQIEQSEGRDTQLCNFRASAVGAPNLSSSTFGGVSF